MNQRRSTTTIAVLLLFLGLGILVYAERPWSDSSQASRQNSDISTSELPIGMVEPASAPKPGRAAPDFVLPRADGSKLRLSDLRGKPVFLNFWASWCPFCLEEMPDMERVHQELGDAVVILGVNNGDSVADGEALAQELGVTYEVVYDPDRVVVEGYRIEAMPTSYFIDAEGVIVDF